MLGDIGVIDKNASTGYECVFEVKDKPINENDIQRLLDSALEKRYQIVSMVSTSPSQKSIDVEALTRWAEARSIRFRCFIGWHELLEETLFWSPFPEAATQNAYRRILERCVSGDISAEGIDSWKDECSYGKMRLTAVK